MPIQYNKLEIHQTHSIDIEWNKANVNLSCNLPSDSIENIQIVDLSLQENDQDPSYLPLPPEEQNKIRTRYKLRKTDNIKKLIVIGIPHGGTTWFATKVLNKHPSIKMHNELLFGWVTSYCNAHLALNYESLCNWQTMKSIMETFYMKEIGKSKHNKEHKFNYYIGFKITLWQIMPTMYGEFVRWIYCNNITVIQLIRSASINSFYSEQVMVFENLFYGRKFYKTQYSKKHTIGNETFDLDAKYAKTYVQSTEFWQGTLSKLLKFHKKSINVMLVYYEDLIGDYSINYLNALQGYLNVKYDADAFVNQEYGIARLHSTPCHVKVKNWYDAIKYELVDTDSYYACEKENS